MSAVLSTPSREREVSSVRGIPLWGWLLLGVVATFFSGMRFNVPLMGWVSAVPFLVYLRRTESWSSRLVLGGVLQVAMFLALLKIVTAPLPWFFAAMFSVPMGFAAFFYYWGFEALRRRLGDAWGLALFPAMTLVLEWSSAHGSEMGSWGALAYTQLDNPVLMQVTSLFGLSGVSVLLAAVSAFLAVVIDDEDRARWRPVGVGLGVVVLAAHIYGAVRLYTPLPGPMVTVATVVSDIGPGPAGFPAGEVVVQANDRLFAQSALAAEQGADLVVWNEGATAIDGGDEEAFLTRGAAWSETHQADLVMAYVVPVNGMDRFENKYVWMTPDGPIETYFKHHPVPSEGSIRGTDPLVAHDRPYGRAAGAICYDYDFPAMGRDHADLGIDLAVVPASDWAGIDPYHTQMASVRGIEGGYSVVRSTRAAISAAYDAHGVLRGRASELEGERLMITQVPAQRVWTLYSVVGDVLPVVGLLVFLVGIVSAGRRGVRRFI